MYVYMPMYRPYSSVTTSKIVPFEIKTFTSFAIIIHTMLMLNMPFGNIYSFKLFYTNTVIVADDFVDLFLYIPTLSKMKVSVKKI